MLRVNGHQVAGVIFDIDGTLVDSFATLVSVLNIILKKYQLESVSEEFLASCFRRNMNLAETLHERYSSSFEEPFIETLRSEILDLFLKVEVEEVKPFPGVDRLFEKLKNHQLKIGFEIVGLRRRSQGAGVDIDAIADLLDLDFDLAGSIRAGHHDFGILPGLHFNAAIDNILQDDHGPVLDSKVALLLLRTSRPYRRAYGTE